MDDAGKGPLLLGLLGKLGGQLTEEVSSKSREVSGAHTTLVTGLGLYLFYCALTYFQNHK